MTPPPDQVSAFFASDLGKLVLILLTGVVSYFVTVLKTRGDMEKKFEENKAEIEKTVSAAKVEAERVATEREQENNRDREAIRRIMLEGQEQNDQLRRDLVAANALLNNALNRESKWTIDQQRLENALQEALTQVESGRQELEQSQTLNRDLQQRVQSLDQQRASAALLVEQRDGELAEAKKQNGLQAERLTQQEQDIEHLKRELKGVNEELDRVNRRVAELEKKPTGPLPPAPPPAEVVAIPIVPPDPAAAEPQPTEPASATSAANSNAVPVTPTGAEGEHSP